MYSYIKRLGLLLCFFMILAVCVKAQDSQQPATNSTISLGIVVPATIEGLTDASVSLLGNKLAIIVTNNGLATTDKDQAFIIFPQFAVTGVQTTSSTMQKLYIANCTLSLFIKQQSTKTLFANITKNIQGSGYTKEEAIASAVTSISVDDDAFAKFIDRGKAKIIAWYQQNCQVLMTNAAREIVQKHYDAAKTILESIPQETGECYTTAQKKIADIFSQQYGSLDNAAVYLQKEVIIDPADENVKQKLAETKKLIEARNSEDKSPPEITLLTPKVTRGQGVEADVTKGGNIYVSGTAVDPSGIGSVSINGKALESVRPDGFFQANVNSTITDIVVEATDKKGNTASATFHIATKTDEKTLPDEILPLSDDEKFHAIFIANSNYSGGKWPALKTTIDEAKALRQVLIDKYNFKPENIDTVFNKTRKDILSIISNKMQKLGANDNLVLFYGGHGYFVESTNMAYWVPLSAESEYEYISNTDISNLMASCQARHILVMADACFSGAMRGGLNAPSKYEYKFKSRQLLTSGGTEPVPGKSAYVEMVLQALNTNQDKYVSARELYTRIAKGIMDQTKTEPTIRDLNVSGSMGGQFYFKKN